MPPSKLRRAGSRLQLASAFILQAVGCAISLRQGSACWYQASCGWPSTSSSREWVESHRKAVQQSTKRRGAQMALEVTPVYRNLGTRVTFLGLEAEDLFAILALAVVTNILGRFLHREMFGLPMNMFMQYLVPLGSVPALMLFKYGKQRGYLQDWVMFHSKPHVYSAVERDGELASSFIRREV